MANVVSEAQKPTSRLAQLPFYYGWIMLIVAALAMVATLPGRTQGLGLMIVRRKIVLNRSARSSSL